MKPAIPEAALRRHTAIVGMTGSGKTSTSKLLIEQVVAAGSRVCILDPIKSDWWGLTSNKAGTGPGLPFQILGGPHGHVPLHAGAGAPIGELVASGKLPLSIIDMADFGPGGLQKFFNDFAPTLIRKMRGVLYLVIEEAHEFCPKEKSGAVGENMAVYYAKKLATAGRSKGVRLVVASQRVQALHNAVLGSCETVIVHRMTLPADQEPVTKWLKGSVKDKAVREEIEQSMPELADGEGWICSGSAKVLERIQFPRIHTFDNSATPEDDEHRAAVVTAKVDVEQLRTLIGSAVDAAAENDPAELKRQITVLQRQLAQVPTAPLIDEHALQRSRIAGFEEGRQAAKAFWLDRLRKQIDLLRHWLDQCADGLLAEAEAPVSTVLKPGSNTPPSPVARHKAPAAITHDAAVSKRAPVTGAKGTITGGAPRALLIALAQNPDGLRPRKLAILANVQEGGSTWRAAFAKFRREALVTEMEGLICITRGGLDAVGSYEPLPTGAALRLQWRARIGGGAVRAAIFDAVMEAYPSSIASEQVASWAGVEHGGSTWRAHMARLRGLELVSGSKELKASEDLFE